MNEHSAVLLAQKIDAAITLVARLNVARDTHTEEINGTPI